MEKKKILTKCLLFVAILFAILLFSNSNVFAATINVNSKEDYLAITGSINYATEDSTIVLNTDITLEASDDDSFDVYHNIVLDLNGHTITLKSLKRIAVWYQVADKTFTIKNGNIVKKSGYYKAIDVWQYPSGSPSVTNNSLIIDGITFTNESSDLGTNIGISEILPSAEHTMNFVIKNSTFTISGALLNFNNMGTNKDYWSLEMENTTIKNADNTTDIAILPNDTTLKYQDIIDVNKSEIYGDEVLLTNTADIESWGLYNKIEIKNKDNTCIVMTAQELKDAFDNDEAYKIKLGADITAENLYFYVNEDHILDLNGFTLELNKLDSFGYFGNLSIHFMGQETTVQIVDESTNKYGKIIGGIKAVTNESNFSSKGYTLDINDIKLETIENAAQHSLISLDLENDEYWNNTDKFNLIINNSVLEHFGASIMKSAIGIYNQAGLEENVDLSFGNLTYINNDAASRGLIYGNNVKYYKVSDIIDESYELESSSYLGNNPNGDPIFEKTIANRTDLVDDLPYDADASRGFLWNSAGHNTMVIKKKDGFEVTAPTFASRIFGYADEPAEAISIKTIGPDRTIDYVDIDNHTDFVFTGLDPSGEHLVASGATNTIATIKPNTGLSIGTHTATITVVDTEGIEYYATVRFKVTRNPETPIDINTITDYDNEVAISRKDGDAIYKLMADINLTGINDLIRIYDNVTIDLNGFELTTNKSCILNLEFMEDNKSFKIIDTSALKTGKLIGTNTDSYAKIISAFVNENLTGTIELDGITVESDTDYLFNSSVGLYNNHLNVNIKNSTINKDGKIFGNLGGLADNNTINFENTTIEPKNAGNLVSFSYTNMELSDVIDTETQIAKAIPSDGSELEVIPNDTVINLEEYKKIVIESNEGFKVTAPKFAPTGEGYSSIDAEDITITAVGGDRTIRSVEVTGSDFIYEGPSGDILVTDGTNNIAFSIKPKDNLKYGEYTATISVKDTDDNVFTAEVSFNVNAYAETQIVMNEADLRKFTEAGSNSYPEVKNIKLGANITLASWLGIYPLSGKTLDLNGNTLTTNNYITVIFGTDNNYKNSTFNLIDSSGAETGAIIGTSADDWALLYISENYYGNEDASFTFNLNGGTYSSADNMFGFRIDDRWDDNSNNILKFNLQNAKFNLPYGTGYKLIYENSQYVTKDNLKINLEDITITLKGAGSGIIQETLDLTVGEIIPETHHIAYPRIVEEGLVYYSTDEMISAERTDLAENIILRESKSGIESYQIKVERNEGFEVTAPTFTNVKYGYGEVTAKGIEIATVGSNRTVKSVTVNETSKFEVFGIGTPIIVEGTPDNTTFTIKPRTSLNAGTHTATITVTDSDNNTFTAPVTFVVERADLTSFAVSLEDWNTNEPAKEPQITGNTGSGEVTYEYKVKDAEDSTYSSTVPTTAGTYTVRATVVETTNYNQATATDDFTLTFVPATHTVATPAELNERLFYTSAVTEEVTVKLGASIDVAEIENSPTVYVKSDLTIDLNGKTLNLDAGRDLKFWYYGSHTVKIIDSSAEGTGKIVVNRTVDNGIDLVIIDEDKWDGTSKFILDGIDVEKTTNSYGVLRIWNNDIEEANKFDVTIKNTNFKIYDEFIKGNLTTNNLKVSIEPTTTVSGNEHASTLKIIDAINAYSTFINPAKSKVIVKDAMGGEEYELNLTTASMNSGYYSIRIIPSDGFEVTATTFANATYGYSSITALPISIKTIGADRTIESVTVSDTSKFIVNGSGKPTITSGNTDNTTFTINPLTGLGAGTHAATITVEDSEGNKYTAPVTFVVGKANITPSVSIDNWEYSSTASNPSVIGNTESGTETFRYIGTNSTSYDSETKPTEVGTYKVIATIGETDNYNSATCEDTFEITKKIINVDNTKLTINNKNYDGTTDVEATYTDAYSELSEQITTTATMDSTYDEFVGAKTGTITATLSDNAYNNYSFADNAKTHTKTNVAFNINALSSTITDISGGNSEVVKTIGKDLRTLISLNPEAYKDDVTFAIDGTFTGVSLNADGYTLQADNTAVTNTSVKINVNFAGKELGGSSDKEYNGASTVTIYVKVVDKPSQTFNETASTINMTYGDERSNPYTLLTGNGIISYSTSDNNSVSVDNTGKLTAKKVTATPVTITVTAQETATHAETSLTYEVNVSVKDVTVSAGTYKVTKTYDGTATKVAGTGTLDITGILPTDTGVTVVATTNDFSKSDVYNTNEPVSLALSGEGKDNYNLTNATLSVPYSITPKTITPTIAITGTYTYTGSAITPTYTVKDGETDINASQYTARFEDNIDAGTNAKVIVTANNNANYTWTEKTQTFSIGKADYAGTITALNKNVLENTEKSYEISLTELALPNGFVDASITNATKSGELIKSVSNTSSKVTYISESKTAGTTGTLTITVSSKNYNNKDVTVNVTAVSKTLVTISGLTYTDRDYNENKMTPTGTLTANNGYDVDNLEVLYEGVSPTVYSNTQAPTNAGTYKVTYKVPETDNDFTGSKVYTFEIRKATPTYTAPTELNAVKGSKLSTITLPSGLTWNNGEDTVAVGTNTYKATFTPSNTDNYEVLNNEDITVYGKNIFAVDTNVSGGNGTISAGKIDVVEGENFDVTFTPNTGYMIDEVIVGGTGVTPTNNQLTLLNITESKNVTVSYKKIPFALTVEEVTGATITPNGTINVEYGDNKLITITANHGYKLKSVKVNDVEKIEDIVSNQLQISNITSNTNVKVTVEKIVYDVTEGKNQTHILDEDSDATFRIDADYSLFDEVYVDNELLSTDNYTSKSGSTVITLDKDYLDTLSEDTHSLKVTFTDGGIAEAQFRVAKKAETSGENNNSGNLEGNGNITNVDKKTPNKTKPTTGDNITMYSIIFVVSLLGITTVYILGKKKFKTKK